MDRRVKIYSALNVLGWVLVMPILLVLLLNPFINFSGWPGASMLERQAAKVALLPPRLTEYGSLPPLTRAPRPESRVPLHAPIAAVFRPALPGGSSPDDSRGSRGGGGPSASPQTRARRPARRRPGRRPTGERPTTRVVPPAAASPPRPVTPPATPQAPPAKPERPKPPAGTPKPDDPQHGQGNGNGNGKPDDPQHGQGNGNGNGNGKPDDPQHGQGNGNGKPDDPRHGEKGKDKPDDPRQGEQGRGRSDDPRPGNGRGRG